MGIRKVLGEEPIAAAKKAVNLHAEQNRRGWARKRVQAYQDDLKPLMHEVINRTFQDREIREQVRVFLEIGATNSMFRRIVNEVCRHTYRPGPRRKLSKVAANKTLQALLPSRQMDSRMGLAMDLAQAGNTSFLYPRIVRDERIALDVLSADMVTVIPDPDDPLEPLAYVLDSVDSKGKIGRVIWDDEQVTKVDSYWNPVSVLPNDSGVIPIVPVHRYERWGTFWDTTTGSALFNACLAVNFLELMSLRLLKTQGFRAVVLQGDTMKLPNTLVLDDGVALPLPEGVTATTLDLKSDANHFRSEQEGIMYTAAANYGLNRERLNAKAEQAASEVSLLEHRREQIDVAARAEHALLKVLPAVSRGLTDSSLHLPDDVTYDTLDFGELEAKLSLKEQIDLWDKMESMGMLNILEIILAQNPEMRDEEEALERYKENLDIRAMRVQMERELNAPKQGPLGDAGQSPEDNGSLPQGNGVRGEEQGNSPGQVDERTN